MLYNLFRKSVKDAEVAVHELMRVASPSPDEWTEEAKVYLPKLREIHEFLVEASDKLPEELEDQENLFFGPRIPKEDVLYVLSKLAPVASDINLSKALYSYSPSVLYKYGVLFVSSTIEFYWGFQKYNWGEYRTKEAQVSNFFPIVDSEFMRGIVLNDFLDSIEGFKVSLLKGAKWDFGNDFNQI